ncbi:putative peptide zinc metalloprotease protein YydH [Rubripirellula obstinata]|uniref:Putative peptide zinc metalloprotease protein YydH n=1 Tax=Rubripirellula obstinata TaxID=406547 RepID=A0A5B1C8Y5_9BACT|nr:site-2 protease family protein [Rubripirellula obstinata]KAA1257587.1 putative peptide zinc metalloprotease protein YydH [Rubripirellula obstinata]
MMETPDPNAAPPSAPRVAMDDAVTFEQRTVGGRTQVIASHVTAGKFFQLGPVEFRIAELLDGSRDIGEITTQLNVEGIDWEAEDVAELVSRFVTNKVASPIEGSGPPTGPAAVPAAAAWSRRLPGILSMAISQRIPLVACNRIAEPLARHFGFIFSRVGIVMWLVLVVSGMGVVLGHRESFFHEIAKLFDPSMWVVMFGVWLVAKVLHELGHATSAKYHGVHVGKAGIMFFLFAPLAYVDVTDAWKLRSRWKRVQIALSGVYIELAIASMAAWAWLVLPPGFASHLMVQIFFVTGPATLLVNANPLLRLDGYYVLSDLTEIPNLRMHGRNQLAGFVNQWLVKIPADSALLSGWRQPAATLHAIASVIFQIVWMGGLVLGVALWFKGLGVFLALVATILWAVLPLTRWMFKVWKYDADAYRFVTPHRTRLCLVLLFVVSSVSYFAMATSPFARRVPVVVRFCDEQIARAATNAFVQDVFVQRGERVSRGALLVQLDAPELLLRRDELADQWQSSQMREVQLRRTGDLAMAASESERAASFQRQLAELNAEVASLRITASRDGLVTGAGIESLQGSFVKEGSELLCVCDPQEKELLVAVTTRDVEAYNLAVSHQHPSTIRLRGGKSLVAMPPPLRPRASQSLPHPALGANAGGPLAVEPSPEEAEMRSASPLMQSVALLDPLTSAEVQTGQIGMMTISDNRSLVQRLIESVWR